MSSTREIEAGILGHYRARNVKLAYVGVCGKLASLTVIENVYKREEREKEV